MVKRAVADVRTNGNPGTATTVLKRDLTGPTVVVRPASDDHGVGLAWGVGSNGLALRRAHKIVVSFAGEIRTGLVEGGLSSCSRHLW